MRVLDISTEIRQSEPCVGKNRHLETHIEQEPERLDLRLRAIYFYHKQKASLFDLVISKLSGGWKCSTANQQKRAHILWIIKNAPGANIGDNDSFQISPYFDPKGFVLAEQLWSELLESQSQNLSIKRNAGQFFIFTKPEKALEIYISASLIEPDNFEWRSKANYARWLLTGSKIDGIKWNISYWKWKLQIASDQSSAINAQHEIQKYELQLQNEIPRDEL